MLFHYRTEDERLRLLTERQAAAERGLQIAQAQFEAWAINSIESTDAECSVKEAQRDTVAAATGHRLAVVDLSTTLGGGWNDEPLFTSK